MKSVKLFRAGLSSSNHYHKPGIHQFTSMKGYPCLLLLLFWGSGANGKSTLLRTIGNLLGDFSQHTATETLLIKQKGAISNDIARMKGARFITASESEAEHKLAENLSQV
ncbi:MAG: hypothetical protein PF503_17070 [Desulfobacula sp.]|nr:hypothetical protein [Desulfobacula sp.]